MPTTRFFQRRAWPARSRASCAATSGSAAVTFRPSQKLSITGEAEGASSGGAYFRTSLYDYQKVRAQARYQATTSLSLSADFTLLNNQNPVPGVNYDYLAHQESLSLFLVARGRQELGFRGFLQPLHAALRHRLSRAADSAPADDRSIATTPTPPPLCSIVNLPHRSGLAPKLTAGGSFFISSGSRPTSYYQPHRQAAGCRSSKNLNWFTEWRYYGYGEAFYLYEGFRTHLVTTGLRFTR